MLNIRGFFVLLPLQLLVGMCSPYTSQVHGQKIVGILNEAKDLTSEEIIMLKPLFDEMQIQYDVIKDQHEDQQEPLSNPTDVGASFKDLYTATIEEILEHFTALLQEESIFTNYDTSLPTAKDIMGDRPNFETMTAEQIDAYLDMQNFLQDSLDEIQLNFNALVKRSAEVEKEFLKLNKPKIIATIYKSLNVLFEASVRILRAAYCTYSHIPQLNASLHHIYEGVDCYFLATAIIVKIQNETFETAKIIRRSVSDLAIVYKKISAKQSIIGKIVSLMKNTMNILRSVLRTLRQANHIIDEALHQLPVATLQVINCGARFGDGIPYVVKSVANTTTCIMYVDNEKYNDEYDWMEPENSTRIPEIIPDPESGELDGSFEMP